ncbi:MAG: hypothetical protein AABZ06_05965, partial [Bdellovibrionota bacterium]
MCAFAEGPYIPVGSARMKKTILAFPEIKSQPGTASSLTKTVHETVTNDLAFMDLFKFLGPSAFIEPASAGISQGTFKMSDWTSIGAEFVIKTSLGISNGSLFVDANLYDVNGAKQILEKKYIASIHDAKTVGHTLANNIVERLTGLPGIFLTKIAMSCDRTGKKEIYIMDFDGSDVKQITNHRSIAFAPAWSPDGTRIAYSLFTKHRNNIKNIDLFEFNFTTSSVKLLSDRRGINSGAAYSPDGRYIALTMSFLGNPEIFSLDPATREVSRLTKSFGVDVDPTWRPDGKAIAFVSNRTGRPMVYTANIDGSNIQRLTYAGDYNATPSWSLQNNKIAFAGWIEKTFDIFLMNPGGTNIERLTKHQENNEDP